MNAYLLNRSLGLNGPGVLERAETTHLLHALQPAINVNFSAAPTSKAEEGSEDVQGYAAPQRGLAHASGVNAITIDKFEGRYLLSGGADSSITIWDLESSLSTRGATYVPLSSVHRTSKEHKFGITQLIFYPFDSLAFLSSSYDHTVKLYSSETLSQSASFDLDSVVYTIALSPIASHLLVACATQHPAVRLVDLRSGARTHSLAGHNGAVLSVAWSPTLEHILASGSTDGTVRFWDIRRGSGDIGGLDMEDSLGIIGRDGFGAEAPRRCNGKAHAGAVNGLVWTEDGRHLVSAGHDERVRVWDTTTGANTLASFGPLVRNSHLSSLIPLLAPSALVPAEKDVMFYPNEHEILMYELFEGEMVKRLRRPSRPAGGARGGGRNVRNRITALAWRAHDVEFYSAHSDGSIGAWMPRSAEDVIADEEEREGVGGEDENESRKRKREVLEDVYRDLMMRKVTYGSSSCEVT
ncbi:WD40 repeat-like protein [Lepidopterella palustris CBS 459.81]|uniref:WD40 repeat-like protein n=1 Tax=Lepidopterella palustris CBS 459.81 TaxID=1314670 RepID=A0A8E2EET5_9PEZI|nr:WD40 repeat-like protein [Lepidopterella palustris CBS 459.81]